MDSSELEEASARNPEEWEDAELDAHERKLAKRWRGLRLLHRAIQHETTRHRGACIENVLWEISSRWPDRYWDPRYDVGVGTLQLVAIVVNAYGFERRGNLERRLVELCRTYETNGLVDWRGMVCCLHALTNAAHCYERPMKLLQHFFSIYALPAHANAVARVDALSLVSLAAIRHDEVRATKQALDDVLLGDDFVKYSTMVRALTEKAPGILEAFRSQMWKRVPASQKLTYLKTQEEACLQKFDRYMSDANAHKASGLWRRRTMTRCYGQWRMFLRKCRVVRVHVRGRTRGASQQAVARWHEYAVARRVTHRRRKVASVFGRRALARRTLGRWRRWVLTMRRISRATGVEREYKKRVAQGSFFLRLAVASCWRRRALGRWHGTTRRLREWDTACAFAVRLHKTWHVRAWRESFMERRDAKRRERDCVERQRALQQLLQEADEMRRRALSEAEARAEQQKKDDAERARVEQREKLAWAKRRRDAERAVDLRLTREVKEEARVKRAARAQLEKAEAFARTWGELEVARVSQEREARQQWLASKESKNTVLKEFKRVRREFYRPPTPRSMDREAKLKSLASIVLIKIEAILFKQRLILEDIIRQYDSNGRGYLSHQEFRRLVDDLPVDLSSQQVRQIISEIDSDDDGYIDLNELQKALDVVHQYNGPAASPWRMYIDPAQDVMCYANLLTGEAILEHRMTDNKLREITRANYMADAELEAVKRVRQDRQDAWVALVNNDAATVIQRMVRHHRAGRERDRLHWKLQARLKQDRESRAAASALRIQLWYRVCCARWIHGLAVKLHVEAIPDLQDRCLYYYNHMSGTCSWDPPPRPVHRPQDFVGTGPYVEWDQPPRHKLRRLFHKPAGYPRCTRCLQSLALLECDQVPGTFCFACFRETVDLDFLRGNKPAISRVVCARCAFCGSRAAAWRCLRDNAGTRLQGRLACPTCQPRLDDRLLEWIRV